MILISFVLQGCPSLIANVVTPSQSIQNAIDKADPGDTIKIMGTHNEDIVIDKANLTLKGQDGATINGHVTVKADGVAIQTLTITEVLDTPTGSFANLELDEANLYDRLLNTTLNCTAVVNPSEDLQSVVDTLADGDAVCLAPNVSTAGLQTDKDFTFVRIGRGEITITPSATKIYWTASNKIQRSNLDGSNVENVVTGISTPWGLALDTKRDYVYWTEPGSFPVIDKIRRATIENSNIETLVENASASSRGDIEVALDESRIYWIDEGPEEIRSANLDGSDINTVLHAGADCPLWLTLEPGIDKLYWTGQGTKAVKRSVIDGSRSDITKLVTTNVLYPRDMAIIPNSNHIYWSEPDRIRRADLDGTSVQTIASGLSEPKGLDLDPTEGKLYWATGDSIYRSNLDGTAQERIVSGLDGVNDLELYEGKQNAQGGPNRERVEGDDPTARRLNDYHYTRIARLP